MRSMRSTARAAAVTVAHMLRRQLLAAAPLLALSRATDSVSVRRLHWAGVRIDTASLALFIDPQIVFARKPEIGSDADVFSPAPAQRFAAITHVHRDHFDPEALKLAAGADGAVACHAPLAAVVAAAGLKPLPL